METVKNTQMGYLKVMCLEFTKIYFRKCRTYQFINTTEKKSCIVRRVRGIVIWLLFKYGSSILWLNYNWYKKTCIQLAIQNGVSQTFFQEKTSLGNNEGIFKPTHKFNVTHTSRFIKSQNTGLYIRKYWSLFLSTWAGLGKTKIQLVTNV